MNCGVTVDMPVPLICVPGPLSPHISTSRSWPWNAGCLLWTAQALHSKKPLIQKPASHPADRRDCSGASGAPGQGIRVVVAFKGLDPGEQQRELFLAHFLRMVPNWMPWEAGSGRSKGLPDSQGNGMEPFQP